MELLLLSFILVLKFVALLLDQALLELDHVRLLFLELLFNILLQMLNLFVLLECVHFCSLYLMKLLIPDLKHLSEVVGTEQRAEVNAVEV